VEGLALGNGRSAWVYSKVSFGTILWKNTVLLAQKVVS
jgi:hypothetical protein